VSLLGPASTGTGTIALDPTFESFIVLELVSLMKVFKLFKLERSLFGVESVDTVGRCTTSYLLAGPVCLRCLVNPCLYAIQTRVIELV